MRLFLPLLLIFATFNSSQSHASHSHFNTGGVFELDLGDSEMPLTPKQERKNKKAFRKEIQEERDELKDF
tara:strand:- start:90 stop:299 length:210 start_codon:yes stop_codon:yes gene_type:complete